MDEYFPVSRLVNYSKIATGCIVTRFSKIVGGLLADLVEKAQKADRFI